MKAATYSRYGPPDVLKIRDLPTPAPEDNEVLIHVRASTVCAIDWRFRSAALPLTRLFTGLFRPKPNFVPGVEFAGDVVALGSAVTRLKVGDRVFGTTGFKFGANAEYVALPADRRVAPMPANASYDEAAAIAFGAISALSFLRKANIQTGQHVLIYGASSSVGTAAVQLAKHMGAEVTGVCSAANAALVKSIGADDVIDYAREDFSKRGQIYDVILDAVGKSGYSRSIRALKPGGVYLLVASATPHLFPRHAKVIGGVAKMQGDDFAYLKQLIEQGAYRPVIGRRFHLDEIADAHRYAESGRKVGAAVVTIP